MKMLLKGKRVSIQFETPENVLLSYQPAGLGSRFVAFLIDWLIMLLPLLFLLGCVIYIVTNDAEAAKKIVSDDNGNIDVSNATMYAALLYSVLIGILSVVYFGAFELLMRGQTPGKKLMGLRVVNTEGFRLQPSGVAVRSFFRIIDTLPPLWIVPFACANYQRVGDIVGRTVVVYDTPVDEETRTFREQLFDLNGEPSRTFPPTALDKIPADSLEAATRLLQRWNSLPHEQQEYFNAQFCTPLSQHLGTPEPTLDDCPRFLMDVVLAEFRRQYRKLG